MSYFTVDNIGLFTDVLSDNFVIQSSPNNYTVDFTNFTSNFNDNDFVLIDKNIYRLYGISHSRMMRLDVAEEHKNINTALSVCEWLGAHNFNKGNHLYVIGGGITQDIGAFVGSMYKRGIKWTYVPTTLLSQCDSCIGGKTALNFGCMKNQLALFSAPQSVIIDLNFLESLPQKEILSGMGEIIKFFLIGGNSYLDLLDNSSLKDQIINGLSIKKAIIEYDEFEKNIRKSLNYGHSFGHAIEAASNYSIPHGEAVLLGIEVINQLFTKSSLISNIVNKYTSLEKLKDIDSEHVINLLRHDKKSLLDKITFVVVDSPGITRFVPTEINNKLIADFNEIFTS